VNIIEAFFRQVVHHTGACLVVRSGTIGNDGAITRKLL
jgi:hypothetical protein